MILIRNYRTVYLDQKLEENTRLVYKIMFMVRDTSSPCFYLLYLCTATGKGAEFMDIGLEEGEAPAVVHREKMKYMHKLVTRPWVVLDLIVETLPTIGETPIPLIVSTKLVL